MAAMDMKSCMYGLTSLCRVTVEPQSHNQAHLSVVPVPVWLAARSLGMPMSPLMNGVLLLRYA